MGFEKRTVLPGVTHIRDELGVCMTLLTGSRQALLVDTGYGTDDVFSYVRTLTALPLTVILTHGHHDHALGARQFRRVLIDVRDLPVYRLYTGAGQREKVLASAGARGVRCPDDYLTAEYRDPEPLTESQMDLGGMTAVFRLTPGHTPGSVTVLVPERELLLTGDDWNPVTWLFFPEALGAREYRANIRALQRERYRHVLCPHRFELFDRAVMDAFIDGLTDECLARAVPTPEGDEKGIRTLRASPAPDQTLVFAGDRYHI